MSITAILIASASKARLLWLSANTVGYYPPLLRLPRFDANSDWLPLVISNKFYFTDSMRKNVTRSKVLWSFSPGTEERELEFTAATHSQKSKLSRDGPSSPLRRHCRQEANLFLFVLLFWKAIKNVAKVKSWDSRQRMQQKFHCFPPARKSSVCHRYLWASFEFVGKILQQFFLTVPHSLARQKGPTGMVSPSTTLKAKRLF